MSESAIERSYDEVLYPHGAFPQTHPSRLAALGILFGMPAPGASRIRVLELGCATGGNLIPMAYSMPDAEFLGVDLSARQIEHGRRWVDKLGLRNITLDRMNILELPKDIGRFDAIIAHGVFSWVPREVQDKILEVLRDHLAPSGIGYVSYNAYPGWHTREMLREMRLFHIRAITDPSERARQARVFIGFLASGARNLLYKEILREELRRLETVEDAYLLHDDIAEVNQAFYFHEVVERASSYGLQYVTEALFASVQDHSIPAAAREALRQIEDPIAYEEMLDAAVGRSFRQTLLCHGDIPIKRSIERDRLRDLAWVGRASPVSPRPEIHGRSPELFATAGGSVISATEPVAKAAMLHLSEVAPIAVSFGDLFEAARRRLGRASEKRVGLSDSLADGNALADVLLMAFSSNMVECLFNPTKVVTRVSDRPLASRLARLQAEEGPRVTTLLHENLKIEEPLDRFLLTRLDGEETQASLIEETAQAVINGRVTLLSDGEAARFEDIELVRRIVAERLPSALGRLAKNGLLEG